MVENWRAHQHDIGLLHLGCIKGDIFKKGLWALPLFWLA
jgi:hypothetical protein